MRVEPGVELFHEGEHADFWWVLVDGAIDLVRHVGREETVVGRMDVPGRWAGGFRAWDEHGVYLATGRGVARAGAPGAGRRAARAVQRLVPVRRPPDRGPVPHGAQHRGDRAAAGVAGHPGHARRRARARAQQPGRRRHPRRRLARAARARPCSPRSAGSPTATSRPQQFTALDALRREIEPPAPRPGPAGRGRPRGRPVGAGWPATASSGTG